jgi:hypothetical protein
MVVYCENHIEFINTLCVKLYSVMILKPTLLNVTTRLDRFQPHSNGKYGIAYNGC